MSSRKKFDISPQTMISTIETETKALLPEMPKGLKPKLISIQETVKLLSKKINYRKNFNYGKLEYRNT